MAVPTPDRLTRWYELFRGTSKYRGTPAIRTLSFSKVIPGELRSCHAALACQCSVSPRPRRRSELSLLLLIRPALKENPTNVLTAYAPPKEIGLCAGI